jgi:hypothetical protein
MPLKFGCRWILYPDINSIRCAGECRLDTALVVENYTSFEGYRLNWIYVLMIMCSDIYSRCVLAPALESSLGFGLSIN